MSVHAPWFCEYCDSEVNLPEDLDGDKRHRCPHCKKLHVVWKVPAADPAAKTPPGPPPKNAAALFALIREAIDAADEHPESDQA